MPSTPSTPYVPSRYTCCRALRAFTLYAPYSWALPTRLLRTFHALRALFEHVKIALGWNFSPAKTSKNPKELFQKLLKELLTVLL